ncbi:MAG: cytidylate kinase-like family protein [Prolixibacteraceae bacterium]|nr:cytidylate kinase-like family protein [Prolixibacteraceae bacterium]
MENTLMTYLNRRLEKKENQEKKPRKPGPVITISRESGCSGTDFAAALALELNEITPGKEWKVLSKEIFHHSAQQLNIEPEKVSKIYKSETRNIFEELLDAFNNKDYHSDWKIRKTVVNVIRSFAEDGYCIIVGRAGNIIAADIENSLHLRFLAPYKYRLKRVMAYRDLGKKEAAAFIDKVENERNSYRNAAWGNKKRHNEIFDMTLNCKAFGKKTRLNLVVRAVREKLLL